MPEKADILQIGLGFFPQQLGHRTRDVGRLVDPAALLTGGRTDIPKRRPEPKRTIADGKLRVLREPSFLQAAKQVSPTVCVLPEPAMIPRTSFSPYSSVPIMTNIH